MHRIFELGLGVIRAAALVCLVTGAAFAEQDDTGLSYTLTPIAEPFTPPNFVLKDLDGHTHKLIDYRGKVVLVNFWGTWCPPCIHEMPSIEHLYQKLKGEPFAVLAVNQWETEDHVFPFLGQMAVFPTFPILFDPTSAMAEAFGVRGLPSSYILDKQGRAIYRAQGGRAFDHPDIERVIRGLF